MALYRHFGLGQQQQGPAANLQKIASKGGKIQLTNPSVVLYAAPNLSKTAYLRLLAPGTYPCDASTFGNEPYGVGNAAGCYLESIAAGGVVGGAMGIPSPVSRTVDEGQPFQVDENLTVWYGSRISYPNGIYTGHDVPTGTFVCGADQFGPDPAIGQLKKCLLVPHLAPAAGSTPITYYDQLNAQQEAENRAQAAYQAQQDVYQAQLAIQEAAVDEAARLAQLARNAAAQQAAAQASSEAYRDIQVAAQKQAEALAVELAKLAAANAADADAAAAAADMAAQAEAIRQATIDAKADVNAQAAATLAAQAAALAELRNQERAEAKLKAAQEASATESELMREGAAGGGGAPSGGMDTTTMLLYGGLALAAVLLLTD